MVRASERIHLARVVVSTLAAFALVASAPALATSASADDNLHHKRNQVKGQVAQAQGALSESSKALQTANQALRDSRAELFSAQRSLLKAQIEVEGALRNDSLMRVRLQQAEAKLVAARAAARAAKEAAIEQRVAIGNLAADNYANGDPALIGLSVVLRSQNPKEATVQLNTVSTLMGRQTTMLSKLNVARKASVLQERKVRTTTELVATQRERAAASLTRTRALQAQADLVKARVVNLVAQRQAAEAAAQRARSADAAQLRALKKQDEQIRQLILARARRQNGGYTGQTGGLLFRPVPGYVTSPFGWRTHPIYGYRSFHDGVDFSAPCGTSVRSVRGGTVISKVWSDVYGNRLFVDLGKVNGKSMTAVYNHLDSYTVDRGQQVSRGSVIARAGNTGWSTGCHLHLTILVNGTPMDPMGYM